MVDCCPLSATYVYGDVPPDTVISNEPSQLKQFAFIGITLTTPNSAILPIVTCLFLSQPKLSVTVTEYTLLVKPVAVDPV